MGEDAKKRTPAEILDAWTERDLSEAARTGDLRPAFCVDDALRQLDEIVAAGRAPILVGPAGVGKTALVYELLRRLQSSGGDRLAIADQLDGRRVLQFSLRRRAASLRVPHEQMGEEMVALIDAIAASPTPITPFFRDIHLAYQFDLEPHLESLAIKLDGPILAEGRLATVRSMIEYHPEIEQYYVTLPLEEPSLEQMKSILAAWNDDLAASSGARFDDDALSNALYLSHRFLSRTRMPRKALDLVRQVASTGAGKRITDGDVIARFCESHRVPRQLIDPRAPLDLDATTEHFAARVLGQTDAVRAVIDVIGLIKAGLSDPRRPFGVFLFVGPTGVGKTHLAQLLAEFLFGSPDRVIRFDMADYAAPAKAEVLFGDPGGGTIARARGVLTQRVSGKPFAVLLLDEFEKAHRSIHDRFLQLMDEGSFINGAGESVSCRSMIIIATSNAGAEIYRTDSLGFSPGTRDVAAREAELDRKLRETFRFEFLNRFDRIVNFHPLSRADIRTIALRELELIKGRAGFAQRGLELDIDEELLDWIAVHGYHPTYGARFLRRTMERHVATALAAAIVRESPGDGARVALTVRGGAIVAFVAHDPSAPTAGREAVELPVGTTEQTVALDRAGLLARSKEVLERAAPLLAEHAQRRAELDELLERMSDAELWDNDAERPRFLERYRELEVAIRMERRLAEPLDLLHEAVGADGDQAPERKRFARRLERAANALREWETRIAEGGPSAVWLALSAADPTRPCAAWLADLGRLELKWCKRLELDAQAVGYALTDGELARLFLDVRGPGAASFLAMESGIHRLHDARSGSIRARCEVIDQATAEPARVRSVRARTGPLGVRADAAANVAIDARGIAIEIFGNRDGGLAALAADLERAWAQAPTDVGDVARAYGEHGTGARDPRTGVVAARIKDVLAGQLDRFLEGWRRAQRL